MIEASLAGRRALVTAGPTWVRIDAVRHLSNLSSGRTGLEIARAAAARDAEVTVLLGPGRALPTAEDRERLRIVDLVTFDDLHSAVREHVGSRRFDLLVHCAAVSDYRPVSEERGKLPSGEEELVLRLRPTPKIVDEVRRLDPSIFLVKFKLEAGRSEAELLRIAAESRARSDADLIVANDLEMMSPDRHRAYLLDRSGLVARVETTAELAGRLLDEAAARLPPRVESARR
jgi:phosphopantothenoylcysteine decarboxylase/phosphopantothenate--cysteine ligase